MPETYCPECDEPMQPIAPLPDGSPRWVCDSHGVWSDPPTASPPLPTSELERLRAIVKLLAASDPTALDKWDEWYCPLCEAAHPGSDRADTPHRSSCAWRLARNEMEQPGTPD